jgi:hypothetical protein
MARLGVGWPFQRCGLNAVYDILELVSLGEGLETCT